VLGKKRAKFSANELPAIAKSDEGRGHCPHFVGLFYDACNLVHPPLATNIIASTEKSAKQELNE